MSYRLGVDVGGTVTALLLFDDACGKQPVRGRPIVAEPLLEAAA